MNRPLLDRSAAVAAMATQQGASGGGGSSGGKAESLTMIPTAATVAADAPRRSGSLNNSDLLKSSLPLLPTLKQEPTCRPTSNDGKNGHNNYANNPPNNNSKSSSPFAFRLADETSRRIDQILLRRPSSAPGATCACTTTADATATAERPSVKIQKHVYRRAAEKLGLRIRNTKKNNTTCTTPPSESAMAKKRQATDIDTNSDNQQHAMENLPTKKKRK